MAISTNYYQGKELKELSKLYDSLLPISSNEGTVLQYLRSCADLLFKAYKSENPLACIEISNYHDKYLSCTRDEIFSQKLTEEDLTFTIAREYGYQSNADMEDRAKVPFKTTFEKAVDALITGEIAELESLISNGFPFNETSSFGHNAALIHYLGSNGFEIIRQQVPLNIVSIIELLKKYEIDWSQKMDIYGGMYNVLQLADTSIHPYKAGLNKNLHIALQTLIP